MTILLVDDDSNLLTGLRRAFRNENCQIRCTTSGDEAFKLLRAIPIQAVVSDQVMEGISGVEFLRQVQRLYPGMIRILLTGHATAEMVIETINSGCAERVFMKPCEVGALMHAIQELAGHRALLAEAVRIVEADQHKNAKSGQDLDRPVGEWNIGTAPCGWDTYMRRLNESSKQDHSSESTEQNHGNEASKQDDSSESAEQNH
jgi:DNA-binding NtrC family response regulator